MLRPSSANARLYNTKQQPNVTNIQNCSRLLWTHEKRAKGGHAALKVENDYVGSTDIVEGQHK